MASAARTAEAADVGGVLSGGAQAVADRLRRPSLAPGLVAAVAALIDAAGLGLGLWFAWFAAADTNFDAARAALEAAVAALAVVFVVRGLGGYRLIRLRRLRAGALAVLALALLVGAVAGPAAALAFVALALPARLLGAALAASALDFGLTERRAVIVGGGPNAAKVIEGLAATPGNDIRVCAIFDDRDDQRSPPLVTGVPKLGTTQALVAFARAAEIDMLIVTLPLTAEKRIREIMTALEVLPLDVRLSAFSADPGFRRRTTGRDEGALIEVMSRPLRAGARAVKRALDIVGACVALVLLGPLMVAAALAIRIDTSGPVLFRQPRHGYNHRPVEVWKFRSMHAADCDPAARRIVTRGDARVTRVGRVIRRLSIDELPQLFNVLAGDLSLVGPRPHALAAVSSRQEAFEAIVQGYAARHKVKPGLTGWAQIQGWRGEIDDPEALRRRVEHDLYYIENWSLWLDLRILALTPFRLLDSRNAY